MAGVFLATFQVVMPSDGLSAGLSHKYRRSEQVVLVVANRPEEISQVIAGNVALESGEVVEVTQWRQLEPARKVFQGKVGA